MILEKILGKILGKILPIYILYTGRELEDNYSVSMVEMGIDRYWVELLGDIGLGYVYICGRYWHGYIGMEYI